MDFYALPTLYFYNYRLIGFLFFLMDCYRLIPQEQNRLFDYSKHSYHATIQSNICECMCSNDNRSIKSPPIKWFLLNLKISNSLKRFPFMIKMEHTKSTSISVLACKFISKKHLQFVLNLEMFQNSFVTIVQVLSFLQLNRYHGSTAISISA